MTPCFPYPYPPAPPYPPGPPDLSAFISTASDNGLFLKKGRLMVRLISQDDNNYARFGSDRGVYISGNDILSNSGEANLLTINPTDGKITLTASSLPTTAGIAVSTNTGNLITNHTGAYLNITTIWERFLTFGKETDAYWKTINTVSDKTGNLIYFNEGTYLNISTIWERFKTFVQPDDEYWSNISATATASSLISKNSGNAITLGSDFKLYVSLDAGEL